MQPEALFISDGGLPSRITQPQPGPLTRAVSTQTRAAQQINDLRHVIPTLVEEMQAITSPKAGNKFSEALNSGMAPPTTSRILDIARRLESIERTLADLEGDLQEANATIDQLRAERNQLQSLYVIAARLNETMDKQELLQLILTDLMRLINADRGAILLRDDTDALRFEMAIQHDESGFSRSDFVPSRGTVEQVWRSHQPILVNDAPADIRVNEHPSVHAQGICAIMCAPLKAQHEVIGIVYVDRQSDAGTFSSSYLDVLAAFCNEAAIAIQNAKLFARQTLHNQEIAAMKMYTDSILMSISSGVLAMDNNGNITRINHAIETILHIRCDDVIGQPYERVMAAIKHPELHQRLRETMPLPDVQDAILVNTLITQPPAAECAKTLNVSWAALHDSEHKRLGNVIVIEDLTDLTKARQVERIFRRYVDADVVEQVMEDPKAAELGGQTRDISVVFADVRGYTRMGEEFDPAALVSLLNKYLKMMSEAIFNMEGTITMFQGDAVMAIFNAPRDQPDHVVRAVHAAWQMRLEIDRHNSQTGRHRPVQVGVGIHTGIALVGNIGVADRLQSYTAIGDVVNSAKRLEEHAHTGQILLSDQVLQAYLASGQHPPLHTVHIDDFTPKGKTHPLKVWELQGIG